MRPGELIPDFELLDENGNPRRLSGFLTSGPLVVFFYPAAMTPGCIKESCHFRDLAEEFAAAGAQRVGISPDPVQKQRLFADRYSFDFPLLSDPDRSVARRFGVTRPIGILPVKRHTFVIGRDARLIEEIASEFDMNAHADRALSALARATPSR